MDGGDDLESLREMMEHMVNTPAAVPQSDQLYQLVAEIKILSQQTAANIIEIGKRLLEAKVQVGHGNWETWLEENLELSPRRAQQFMKVAGEYGNTNTYSFLTPSKAIALLDLPASDRQEFITQPHEINGEQKTVDEMTTRELAEAIRARKSAEAAKADSDQIIHELARKNQDMDAKVEQFKIAQGQLSREKESAVARELNLKAMLETKESVANRLRDEIKDLQQSIELLAQEKNPEPVEKIVEVAKEVVPPYLQRALDEAKGKVAMLEAELASKQDMGERRDDIHMKVSYFTQRIRSFIREGAALTFFGSDFARLSPQAQKEYASALSALEKWTRDMRDCAIMPHEDNVITMEMKEVG